MADFTDFNWQTGDYGEAAKFNAMVDNDRHLRERTDFESFYSALSEDQLGGDDHIIRIYLAGVQIGQSTYQASGITNVAMINLDISSVQVGLRLLEIKVGTSLNTVLTARIYKHANRNYASFWIAISRNAGTTRVQIRHCSFIVHRNWQSW